MRIHYICLIKIIYYEFNYYLSEILLLYLTIYSIYHSLIYLMDQ